MEDVGNMAIKHSISQVVTGLLGAYTQVNVLRGRLGVRVSGAGGRPTLPCAAP